MNVLFQAHCISKVKKNAAGVQPAVFACRIFCMKNLIHIEEHR